MIKVFSKIVRSLIIAFLIVVSTSYVHVQEKVTQSDNINKSVNLSTMALKLDEFKENDIYSAKDTYVGDLTGYVFNCPLCNGTLGCMRSYNIMDGTTTYPDETYGKVQIVASSFNLPCGSIIRFKTNRISAEPVLAIVLDRGVLGNDIDFLSPSLDYALTLGRSVITYDVLREGWGS